MEKETILYVPDNKVKYIKSEKFSNAIYLSSNCSNNINVTQVVATATTSTVFNGINGRGWAVRKMLIECLFWHFHIGLKLW